MTDVLASGHSNCSGEFAVTTPPLAAALPKDALATESGRLRFLVNASETLLSSLDYRQTLQHLSALAVPELGDWCAVDMIDEHGRFARLAVTHTDPAKVELAHALWNRQPPKPTDPTGLPNVIRTGEPEWATEIPDQLLTAAALDEDHLRLIRSLGLKSYILMPLKSKGRVLGGLTLVHAESGRRYAEKHLAVARDFARLAAIAVENAELFKRTESALQREREARTQAERLVHEVTQQSGEVERLLLDMRQQKEAAERRVSELETADRAK
jgi:GAF domain-containing protein